MRPIKTKSTTGWLAPPASQPLVNWLPITTTEWHVSSCWEMSWRERFRTLWNGRVWFHCRGKTHPPIKLSCD